MASENDQPAGATAVPQPGEPTPPEHARAPSAPPFDPSASPRPGTASDASNASYEPAPPAYETTSGTEPAPADVVRANAGAESAGTGAATGRTTISDTAVAKVAGIAARRVAGVVALGSGSRALGALREAVGNSDMTQGVNVEVGETQVAVDINLIAAYGIPLPDVANAVRAGVYSAVEALVGMRVIEVNVEINDVHVPDAEDTGAAPD